MDSTRSGNLRAGQERTSDQGISVEGLELVKFAAIYNSGNDLQVKRVRVRVNDLDGVPLCLRRDGARSGLAGPRYLSDIKVPFQVISDYSVEFLCRVQRGFAGLRGDLNPPRRTRVNAKKTDLKRFSV